MKGWIGVDLDGTLATYDRWLGPTNIGMPVESMVNRVKEWIHDDIDVKIITARVASRNPQKDGAKEAIEEWCLKYIGTKLDITSEKDYDMIELWDDRCVTVELNTGKVLTYGRR